MAVYRVMLSGERVKLHDDELGFVKTEYVLAASVEAAVSKAKAAILRKLRRKKGVRIDLPLTWAIDDADPGYSLWRLLRNESFIFFQLTDDGE